MWFTQFWRDGRTIQKCLHVLWALILPLCSAFLYEIFWWWERGNAGTRERWTTGRTVTLERRNVRTWKRGNAKPGTWAHLCNFVYHNIFKAPQRNSKLRRTKSATLVILKFFKRHRYLFLISFVLFLWIKKIFTFLKWWSRLKCTPKMLTKL